MQLPTGDFYKIRAAQMKVGDCILYKTLEAWVRQVYLHPKSPYIKFHVDIPGQVTNLYLKMDLNHFVYRKEESAVKHVQIGQAIEHLQAMESRLREYASLVATPEESVTVAGSITISKNVVLKSLRSDIAVSNGKYAELLKSL